MFFCWTISNCKLNMSPKLHTYTSVLLNSCSLSVLYLVLSMASSLDAFRSYPLERSCSACLVRQPIDQWLRIIVPLVLNDPYPQILCTSSRYNPNCLTTLDYVGGIEPLFNKYIEMF